MVSVKQITNKSPWNSFVGRTNNTNQFAMVSIPMRNSMRLREKSGIETREFQCEKSGIHIILDSTRECDEFYGFLSMAFFFVLVVHAVILSFSKQSYGR